MRNPEARDAGTVCLSNVHEFLPELLEYTSKGPAAQDQMILSFLRILEGSPIVFRIVSRLGEASLNIEHYIIC